MLFSIIVTVYNKEETLRRCLDSIFQDKSNDYEVIIINDGSTDNSHKIIKDYIHNHSNIKYLYQENEGIGYTRKKAISLSHGEYLLFVDADDTISKDLLTVLRTNITKYNPDIIKYNIAEINSIKEEQRMIMNDNEILTGIEALYKWNSNTSTRYGLFSMYTFKTKLLQENIDIFNPLPCYEDVTNITKILYYAHKIIVKDYIGSNYFRHKNSITLNGKINKLICFQMAYNDILQFYKKQLGINSALYQTIKKYYDFHLTRKEREIKKGNDN